MRPKTSAVFPLFLFLLAACSGEGPGDVVTTEASDPGDTTGPVTSVSAANIPAGVYSVDGMHTYLTFSYSHLGYSYPLLRVTGIDGQLFLDGASMAESTVAIAIDTSTIDTQLPRFNEELQSLQYFDALNHPHITFSSESYEPATDITGTLNGLLTVKGETQPVSLDVTINNAIIHPMTNKPVIGFSATGVLSRSAFGLARNVPFIGDEVTVDIEIEFVLGESEGGQVAAALARQNPVLETGIETGVQDASPDVSEKDFVGHWAVTTTGFSSSGGKSIFDLSIERDGDGYIGWIFNGPTSVEVDGNNIEVDIDWIEGADSSYMSKLVGTLDERGALSGRFVQLNESRFNALPLEDGVFSATRVPESGAARELADLPPNPADIFGVWRGAGGKGGFNKLNYAMTPRALNVRESFKDMDAPHIRCAGYGLVTVKRFGGTIYPVEIIQGEEQITILYGADYIRRIYLDDRPYPENREDTDMGFSTGKWVGDTLVVMTTHITPNFFRAGHGMPISEKAHTIEHYWLDEDGYLRADMWVHDPENYDRPPYFPAYLDKNFAANVFTKAGCDAYSFYKQLHVDGELEEFFSRSAYRR